MLILCLNGTTSDDIIINIRALHFQWTYEPKFKDVTIFEYINAIKITE